MLLLPPDSLDSSLGFAGEDPVVEKDSCVVVLKFPIVGVTCTEGRVTEPGRCHT